MPSPGAPSTSMCPSAPALSRRIVLCPASPPVPCQVPEPALLQTLSGITSSLAAPPPPPTPPFNEGSHTPVTLFDPQPWFSSAQDHSISSPPWLAGVSHPPPYTSCCRNLSPSPHPGRPWAAHTMACRVSGCRGNRTRQGLLHASEQHGRRQWPAVDVAAG